MKDRDVNISGNKGDVIGVGVSGSGNVIGKNVTVLGNISVSSGQLELMPSEYAHSIEAFTEALNELLTKYSVPMDQTVPIREHLGELVNEVKDIKDDSKVGAVKQSAIKTNLLKLADGVLRILPKAAESTVAFTPLAPFSKLIGQSVESLVETVRREG